MQTTFCIPRGYHLVALVENDMLSKNEAGTILNLASEAREKLNMTQKYSIFGPQNLKSGASGPLGPPGSTPEYCST